MADAKTPTVNWERELLRLGDESLPNPRKAMLDVIISGLLEMDRKYGVLPDSTPGIRADRDARG